MPFSITVQQCLFVFFIVFLFCFSGVILMLYLFLGLKISSFRGCRFERRQLFPPQLQMTMSAETTLSAHYINPHLRNATGLSIFFQPPLDSPPFFPCLLYVIPQIQQLFFSFLSFFCVCSLLFVPSWAVSFFIHPSCSSSPSFFLYQCILVIRMN